MALPIDIPSILTLAKASLVIVGKLEAKQAAFKGGIINYKYRARNIDCFMEAVEWAYSQNPDDPTLILTGNFLFSLCLVGPAQQYITAAAGSLPVITGPTSLTVAEGATATFSVTVVSSTPVTYQWYKAAVLISGATSSSYAITNAQDSDEGSFTVRACNSTGCVMSSTATLTVTNSLTGSFYYGDTDYFADLDAGDDDVPYVGTFSITPGSPLVVNFTSSGANNKWQVVRYPVTETTKTTWVDDDGSGTIPDSVYRAIITIGSYKYIISRTALSLDVTNPVVTYS